MPMTFAGEALVADRMAKGATAGDALMQLVLFGFALLSPALTLITLVALGFLQQLGRGPEIIGPNSENSVFAAFKNPDLRA